jgi:predicted nucleic acid-binding protein
MNNQNNIVLDTNALINYLEGYELEVDLVGDKQIVISEISEMEIQCNPNFKSSDRSILKQFLKTLIVIPLHNQIKEKSIDIRLTTRMKLMDSIVAATAQVCGISLITSDEKFKSVKTITLILLPAVNKR